MTYNYIMTLERDNKTMTLNPTIEFGKESGNYYGNGYHMIVKNIGLDPQNIFDCRYDNRLDENKLNEYFPKFARDKWTGENGSCKLTNIEEI